MRMFSGPVSQTHSRADFSSLGNGRRCLELLDAAIDGGLLTRIPKPLRKLPL